MYILKKKSQAQIKTVLVKMLCNIFTAKCLIDLNTKEQF